MLRFLWLGNVSFLDFDHVPHSPFDVSCFSYVSLKVVLDLDKRVDDGENRG